MRRHFNIKALATIVVTILIFSSFFIFSNQGDDKKFVCGQCGQFHGDKRQFEEDIRFLKCEF